MKVIKYDMYGAYAAGVKVHPQLDMEQLGMSVAVYRGFPMGDFVIAEVDNVPTELPEHIRLLPEWPPGLLGARNDPDYIP